MLATTVLLTACTSLPTMPEPPIGCHFPEGTHYVFIGVTTGAALGIEEANFSQQVGRWWVSSERVSQNWRPRPRSVSVDFIPPSRQACGIFADGSTGVMGIPENWHPPFHASS